MPHLIETAMARRSFLASMALGVPIATSADFFDERLPANEDPGDAHLALTGSSRRRAAADFPQNEPSRVQAVVGASHGNFDRVKELISEQPALAKASWDWGFGDWETALGAASHTGRRQIVNMGEFASRYIGSAYGVIRNAYAPDRNPSGSSGGTGTGIAANLGMVGIGEDTGGSIRGPAAVHSLVGLRPTLQLVSRFGMMPANPTTDTMGPMTRTVRDAAVLLDALVGYDPNDPITAYSVGHIPESYADDLADDGLRGARIGVIRDPMDSNVDPNSTGYRQVRTVIDDAIRELRALGAEVVDPVTVPEIDRVNAVYAMNTFETEQATDAYLAQHPNAPYQTLRSILLTGRVIPWRASGMAAVLGQTTDEPGYLDYLLARDGIRESVMKLMADQQLDALVYATFDHPTSLIALDAETNPSPEDLYGLGDNRDLSPVLGFPALTVPAGFTPDGLPVGLEFLGRAFTEEMLLRFGYAFEQATKHRRPPPTTPALAGERR